VSLKKRHEYNRNLYPLVPLILLLLADRFALATARAHRLADFHPFPTTRDLRRSHVFLDQSNSVFPQPAPPWFDRTLMPSRRAPGA
jgi:hypothetical protein